MAYNTQSLKRVDAVPFAAGLAKTLFIYATADTKATVLGAGYFNADYKRFDQGDIIEVISGIGGTLSLFSILITSAKGVSPVTVSPAGARPQTLIMPVQNTDIAAGTMKLQVAFSGSITAARYRTAKPVTTAAKLATAQLGVNGVACTGGAIALTSAAMTPMGAAIAASAITAGAAFTAGQTIEVTYSAVTAFAEGDGWFEIDVTGSNAD